MDDHGKPIIRTDNESLLDSLLENGGMAPDSTLFKQYIQTAVDVIWGKRDTCIPATESFADQLKRAHGDHPEKKTRPISFGEFPQGGGSKWLS